VVSRRGGKDVACAWQLNAFIPVPYSPVTERTIQQQSDIHYYRDGDEIVIFGSATERFANMFNAEARRPMADGLLNPKEKQAWPVLEAILQSLVPKPRSSSEVLAFSVPAAAPGRRRPSPTTRPACASTSSRSATRPWRSTRASPSSSRSSRTTTSRNRVSCGGGMCNATLAFLSIPSIMVSLAKAGDFIDNSVARRWASTRRA